MSTIREHAGAQRPPHAIAGDAVIAVLPSPALSSSIPNHHIPDHDEQVIDLWLHGRSPHTQRAYSADALAFLNFTGCGLRHITLRQLQTWTDELQAVDGLRSTSVSRKLSAVKSLMRFARQLGYVEFDIGAALRLPKLRDTLAERILPEEAIQRMLAVASNARNRVLVRLLYASGGRISEIVNLRWRDCRPRDAAGQVTFFGKGGKTRAVLVSPMTWQILQALRQGAGEDDPIFVSQKRRPLSARQAQRIIHKAATRAAIPAAVSPHWLRHAHASHALERGAPIHLVQATLGHASVATTGRYLHARPTESSSKYLGV